MLKSRFRFIILIVVFVLVFASAVTAYALSATVSLYPANTGSVATSSLYIHTPRMYSYNYSTSSDNMDARIQLKLNGEWVRLVGGNFAPGILLDTGLLHLGSNHTCRVRISSLRGNGGVNGFGTLLDN